MKKKILVDLWHAIKHIQGGLSQDNELIFKIISSISNVETAGVFYSSFNQIKLKTYKKFAKEPDINILKNNLYFQNMLNASTLSKNRFQQWMGYARRLFSQKSELFLIDKRFHNVIWRNCFNKSLISQDKEEILKNDFFFSQVRYQNIPYLNTKDFHFVVFPGPTSIKVSPNTVKIIRYHDAISLLGPDVLPAVVANAHYREVISCRNDAYFVCNSEPTRKSLIDIFPDLEARTFIIPCMLSTVFKPIFQTKILKTIILNRMSDFLIKGNDLQDARDCIEKSNDISYILNLATMEPRKNQLSLIRAWEKLNAQNDPKIKLIIVAHPGWAASNVEEAIKPHLKTGALIHLEKLTAEELPYLYSHAKAFVYPSYDEGFGLPPIEAIQCGCPTIVSDIPAHQWVLGPAASYCNPYSVDSITDALYEILYSDNANTLVERLKQAAPSQLERYSFQTLKNQWSNLFDQLSHLKHY